MPADGSAIIQPVLQWGPSYAGGGPYWTIGSWYVEGGNAAHSGLAQVNVGDRIAGGGYAENCTDEGACTWAITVTNGPVTRTLETDGGGRVYDRATPAVLEVNAVTDCSYLPGGMSMVFTNSAQYMPDVSIERFLDVTTASPWTPYINKATSAPACNYDVTISGNETKLQFDSSAVATPAD
jgi:hypothetical protein